jgi:TRAP-type C4-dicarboxylate transport system permease small subunit
VSLLRARLPWVAWVSRADDGIYRVERMAVTIAMLVMSGAMCLYIAYQFLTGQRAVWLAIEAGQQPLWRMWPSLLMLFGVGAIGRASLRSHGATPALAALVGSGAMFGALLLSWMVLTWKSATVCATLMVLLALTVVIPAIAAVPDPLGTPPAILRRQRLVRQVAGGLVMLGLTGLALQVPEGYSWAQKVSLFLLLWTAFVGASMATHDQRHLGLDAFRKLVPARLTPWYQTAHCLLAALFSLAFAWLALVYWQNRLGQATNPGDIPDWVKVLAIPVSMGLVTLRFLWQALTSALVGALGLSTSPAAAPGEHA